MTEQNSVPPGEAEVVLERQLLELQRLTPSLGFESRVLSRVWRPAPMFLLVWRDRLRHLARSPVRWFVAGLASFGSFCSGLWLANEVLPDAQRALAAASDQVNAVSWNQVPEAVASWMPAAAGYLNGIPAAALSGWTGPAAALMVAPAISLAGLYFAMKRPRGERVRAYAAR